MAALALTVIGAALPPAQAWIMKLLIDHIAGVTQGKSSPAHAHLWALLALQLGVWTIGITAASLAESVREILGLRVNHHVELLVLEKSASLDLAFFESPAFHDSLENVRRDGGWRPALLLWSTLGVAQQVLTVAAMVGLLCRLSWVLVPVVIAFSTPRVLVAAGCSRRQHRLFTDQTKDRRLISYLGQLISARESAQEVRAFALAPVLLARLRAVVHKLMRERTIVEVGRQQGETLAALISMFGLGGAYAFAALRASSGQITLGDLAMYLRAAEAVRSGCFSLFQQAARMYESGLFLRSLFAFLDLRPDAIAGSLRRSPVCVASHLGSSTGIAPRIELRGVTFTYPGGTRPAIRNLSLLIEPGERLMLFGPNGAGKSTLIKLLLRFYDPDEGLVLVNGHDLHEMDPEQWRANCAPFLQDFVTYEMPVRDNITLGAGAEAPSASRMGAAARATGLADLVASLPQGYDTVLGRLADGSVELSIGERQRVALTRTWYRNAPFVILDEPTASLDAQSEAKVLSAYEDLSRGKTTVLISHRLSVAKLADRVAVMEQGELVELGTHGQLLQQRGLYARMYSAQAARYS